jgi:uncharacterized protein YegL
MTNPNRTLIGILVDRSGSMSRIAKDMQGGIDALIQEQKNLRGYCEMTIAQFDNHYEVVTPTTDILNVRPYALYPRGSTALNDAVGKFITDIGTELRNRPEVTRPSKVVIVIVTDGYENSSKEWTTGAIKDLITSQREQWKWEFLFLGKDIDSFSVADSFGIQRGYTMDFADSGVAMAATSSNLANYRFAPVGASMGSYTPEQAKEAKKT